MTEELVKKKRVRAGHRASVSRMVKKSEELLATEHPDTTKLSQLKLSLKEKLEVLSRLDGEILYLVEEEESITEEIEQSDGIKEGIYSVLVRIDGLSRSKTPPPASSTPPRDGARAGAGGTSHGTVKLPKLTIQPFKGDLTTWITFWDSYKAAIHENSSLSDIDKFNYLRSLLQGPALDAVSGLTLTASNYKEAVTVLEKRFGNKQQIVSKHMDVLLNVEPVTSSYNLRGLRQLYDTVESHVRGLQSLGVSSDSYGSLLSSVLLSKLPQELRLILSRELGSDDWKLDRVMQLLETEVQARERASSNTATTQAPRKPPRSPSTATAATLVAGSTDVKPACYFCGQSHYSIACSVVTSIEERKRILRENGRCFVCLKRGHIVRNCQSKSKCSTCNGRHHRSLCQKAASDTTMTPLVTTSANDPSTSTVTNTQMNPAAPVFGPTTQTSSLWTHTNEAVLLQTARASVFNPDDPQRTKRVRIVFDNGSQRSYIKEQLKSDLNLTVRGRQSMSIMTFGSRDMCIRECDLVHVGTELMGGGTRPLSLYAVPVICEPFNCQPVTLCQMNYPHLAGLPLADPSDGREQLDVSILIGSDQYWSFITGETRRGQSGPVAIRSDLGWVLSGPVGFATQDTPCSTLITHSLRVDAFLPQDVQMLDDRLKSFWDLESFGISNSEKTVLDEFQDKICFTGGRYQVSLPWKDPHPPLPDNHQLSLKRLQGLLRRLRHDCKILLEYDSIIKEQERLGIIEKVELSEGEPPGDKIHYLPHHAVVRQDKKTTKVRVVYDASARSNGPSLNDCLLPGPKFDQRIFDLLLRFRVHRVALIADIEKAFLMVSVAKDDRDSLRFLWIDDISKENPEVVTFRFTRVVFGVSSSPFLLNATIRYHLEAHLENHPFIVERLLRSFYVDDVITGASTEDEAFSLYQMAKEILKEGGFNLRKFSTNGVMLQTRIDSCESPGQGEETASVPVQFEETYANTVLGLAQKVHSGERKVLGVRWNNATDQLVMDLEEIASAAVVLEPTKRAIVSLVGRFYDPLGLLSPIVIQFKVFLQELCGMKVDWDQSLSGGLLQRWHQLVSSLQEKQSFVIPRCYLNGTIDGEVTFQLCGFCDASCKAYAAVVYLLIETPARRHVRFVASKTRVAPLKSQTIPRLELLSAVLLARLMSSITQAIEGEVTLSTPCCFTDSTVSLFWIRGVEKSWKPFVQNRVSEIRKLLNPGCWMHCAGRDNPADIPSRGLTPKELATSKLWMNGPDWLSDGVLCDPPLPTMPEECRIEMRANDPEKTIGLLITAELPSIGQLIKCEHFSSLRRLLAVTAKVLRFCQLLLSRIRKDVSTPSSDNLTKAETLWIIEAQKVLVKDKNFPQWRKQFDLFQDSDKVWRCRGRIQNASVSFSTKHPILLHQTHFLTTLFVQRAHERVMHGGVKATLTELRSRVWIVRGRNFVKRILGQCTICKKFEGKPYRAPLPPPLPTFRVEESPPFAHTGVDFAGPLYVKKDGTTRKVWICLFTCCVTRAVHLELVADLSTPTFLRCLKRFTARRGLPSKMISDNGKTFRAAAKVIESIVNHEDVQQYLSGLGVQWVFNLPKAPWWGGVFERLIQSTKRCLRKIIGQASFSYDELLTAVIEVEGVLNSRPLSYVSVDDLDEPLTPSHLLSGRRILSLPDHLYCKPDEENFDVEPSTLTRRLMHINKTLDRFWKRWRQEYLLELRESHRYHRGHANPSQVSVGDVVIVHSANQPRGFWRLGRVKEVLVGRDEKIRGAVLRVAGKGRRAKQLQRPLQLLYPLEICAPPRESKPSEPELEDSELSASVTVSPGDGQNPSQETPQEDCSQVEPQCPLRRSRRAAAIEARDRLMAQALSQTEDDDL